jgi:hypothetical protein
MLGVNWNKWFDLEKVSASNIKDEIQKRFSKTHERCRIRSCRYPKSEAGGHKTDGIIRAVLSASYSPIDDIRVFKQLDKSKSRIQDFYFIENRIGDTFFGDRSSHFSAVTNPEVIPGLPKKDMLFPGFHLRNSEVGFCALTMDISFIRLVCLNGLFVRDKLFTLLRKVHRKIEDEALNTLLSEAFGNVSPTIDRTRKQFTYLINSFIEHPHDEIERFLTNNRSTDTLKRRAKISYDKDPHKSKWGVLQAISRSAQEETDRNKQFEVEALAGKYLAAA